MHVPAWVSRHARIGGRWGGGGGELVYVLTHTNHCIVFDFHSNMSIPLKHKTYSTVFLAQKSVMCK